MYKLSVILIVSLLAIGCQRQTYHNSNFTEKNKLKSETQALKMLQDSFNATGDYNYLKRFVSKINYLEAKYPNFKGFKQVKEMMIDMYGDSLQIKQNAAGKKKRDSFSNDAMQLTDSMMKKYLEINSKAATYFKVEKDLMGQSSEGGGVIAYYDKKDLKKITTVFYGETGKVITEYYFDVDGLFFAYNAEYHYDKHIYINGFKTISTLENRYYFLKNHLRIWLDNDRKSITPSSAAFHIKEKKLLEEVEKLRKESVDQK